MLYLYCIHISVTSPKLYPVDYYLVFNYKYVVNQYFQLLFGSEDHFTPFK